MSGQLWWYTARAGGLVAWALVAASVLWGLALSTRALGRRPRSAWLLDLHRFLGAAAVVFTVIHVGSILLDTYVGFGLSEVLVPFTGTWHPVAVAWGIAGLYLLAAIEITSLLRGRLPSRVWRATHYLSLPLFVLTTVHALSAGTDRHTAAVRGAALGVTGMVAVLAALRARQTRPLPLPAPPAPPDFWAPSPPPSRLPVGR